MIGAELKDRVHAAVAEVRARDRAKLAKQLHHIKRILAARVEVVNVIVALARFVHKRIRALAAVQKIIAKAPVHRRTATARAELVRLLVADKRDLLFVVRRYHFAQVVRIIVDSEHPVLVGQRRARAYRHHRLVRIVHHAGGQTVTVHEQRLHQLVVFVVHLSAVDADRADRFVERQQRCADLNNRLVKSVVAEIRPINLRDATQKLDRVPRILRRRIEIVDDIIALLGRESEYVTTAVAVKFVEIARTVERRAAGTRIDHVRVRVALDYQRLAKAPRVYRRYQRAVIVRRHRRARIITADVKNAAVVGEARTNRVKRKKLLAVLVDHIHRTNRAIQRQRVGANLQFNIAVGFLSNGILAQRVKARNQNHIGARIVRGVEVVNRVVAARARVSKYVLPLGAVKFVVALRAVNRAAATRRINRVVVDVADNLKLGVARSSSDHRNRPVVIARVETVLRIVVAD